MAAAGRERDLLPLGIHRLLGQADRRGGFERDPEDDGHSGRDPAQHAAGVVRLGRHPPVLHHKAVVVFAAAEPGTGETGADFESLAGVDCQHGLREIALQFVEDRFPESRRNPAHRTLDDATYGIAGPPDPVDQFHHANGGFRVRATHRSPLHLGAGHPLGIHRGLDVLGAFHVGDALDAEPFREEYPRHRSGGDVAHRYPRRGAPSAALVPDPVFGLEGVVGVAGPVNGFERLVVGGSGVAVLDHHRYGMSGRLPGDDPRLDRHAVRLAAGRGEDALTRTPAIELLLDVGLAERQPGRTAVHHHADSRAV